MSCAEITESGYRWYRVKVVFAPAEVERAPVELLRYAGAQLRFAADGELTARFSFRAADPRGGAGLVWVLSCFGSNGYFDEGQDVSRYFKRKCESEEVMTMAHNAIEQNIAAWRERLDWVIADCLRSKMTRVETLRAVRAAMGIPVEESAVRSSLLKCLRQRYHSEIFCTTVLARMGWTNSCNLAAVVHPTLARKIS